MLGFSPICIFSCVFCPLPQAYYSASHRMAKFLRMWGTIQKAIKVILINPQEGHACYEFLKNYCFKVKGPIVSHGGFYRPDSLALMIQNADKLGCSFQCPYPQQGAEYFVWSRL